MTLLWTSLDSISVLTVKVNASTTAKEMNALYPVTLQEESSLCCDFCGTLCRLCWSWPPCFFCPCYCPRKTANYLAMAFPSSPSYEVFERNNQKRIHLSASMLFPKEIEELAKFVQIHEVRVARKMLVCVYVRMFQNSPYTLLYSHGNACDVGNCLKFWLYLAKKTKCNIFGYDYRGCGRSTGKPKLSHMKADISAAWEKLIELGVPENEIVLLGFSLGTIATIELASSDCRPAGVVIAGGMATGIGALAKVTEGAPQCCKVVHVDSSCYCDPIENVRLVRNINAPTLVAHGTKDTVISFSNGQTLYRALPERVRVSPLWLCCGHEIEIRGEYLARLNQFLFQELPKMNDPPRRASELPAVKESPNRDQLPPEDFNRQPQATQTCFQFCDPFFVITSQPRRDNVVSMIV